jgi:pilus assembly protein CpaE
VKGDLNQEKLIRALNYALARTRKPQERQIQPENKASMVGFLGSKGGVGTTTLACHWALELSKLGGKVLVVDLDMSSGATSFLMKAESRYTLLDAALNLHRLDRELWNGMACHVQDGVDLIQAPGATAISDAVTAERVRHVLRFAQMQYRWIVIDLGRLNPSSFTILDDSPELFVVTNGELPALHETGRVLRRVLGAGFSPEKLKLLLNRRMKSVSVPGDAIEKALGYPVYASIDDFGAELSEAYAEGQFLGEKLKLRKSVARIVRRWQGVEEKTASNSVFGLLGLRSNGVGAQRAR